MARLWSSGFELNSTTATVEWTSVTSGTIVTTPVRTGTYAGEVAVSASSSARQFAYTFAAAAGNGPIYARAYVRFTSFPASESGVFRIGGLANYTALFTINSSGQLQLRDEDGTIGSVSSALSLGVWYRLELMYDRTAAAGSHVVEGRLDGSTVATSSTRNLSAGATAIVVGLNVSITNTITSTMHIDDVAINDSSGSAQTSWPGAGSITHLRPNAAGDNNDSSGDSTSVDEVTPDDATTQAVFDNNNDTLDVNVDSSATGGIGSSDTVTLVQVGVRWSTANQPGAPAGFNVRVKSAAAGTVASGTSVAPAANAPYQTNATADPLNYQLTSYTDPTTGIAWTPTGTNSLDNMQIGVIVTDAGPDVNISTLWALVEFVPAAVTTTSTSSSTSTSSTSTSQSTSTSSTSTSISTSTTVSTSTSTSTSISTSSTSTSVSSSTSTTTSFSTSTSTSSTSLSTSTSTSVSTSTSTSVSTSTSSTSTSQSTSTSSTSSSTSVSTSSTSTSFSTSTSTSTSSSTSSTSVSTSSTSTSTTMVSIDYRTIPHMTIRPYAPRQTIYIRR